MSRIDQLQEFLQSAPEDSFLQHALALEYLKIGQPEQARKLFETILSRSPDYVGSYYHLGKLLESMGEEAAAILVYEKGISEAAKAGDQHARNELMMAKDEIT